jgi:hypothetical protein
VQHKGRRGPVRSRVQRRRVAVTSAAIAAMVAAMLVQDAGAPGLQVSSFLNRTLALALTARVCSLSLGWGTQG